MAKVEPRDVQDLLNQIEELEKGIQTAGDTARAKLRDIKVGEIRQDVPRTGDGKLDGANWITLGEDEQNKLCQRLSQVRDSLHLVAGLDGPTDPKHIMYGAYASNTAIVLCTLLGFVMMALLLGAIVQRWEKATGTDFAAKIETAVNARKDLDAAAAKDKEASANLISAQRASSEAKHENKKTTEQNLQTREREATTRRVEREALQTRANEAAVEAIWLIGRGGASEANVLEMVILLGALGGTLHLVASLVKYVGNRQLKRSWLLYYLSTPIAGAALAPILYMLLRVGILSPTGGSASGSNIASLNLIAIYAFAALTGLFAKTATDKLAEVFKTAFRSSEAASKDPIGVEKPPGAPTSAGSKSP